jgi:hypothetical protein
LRTCAATCEARMIYDPSLPIVQRLAILRSLLTASRKANP